MSRSTISVAMCTFNGERYLAEQLNSIAAQTLLPDELVLCDDGSSDRTVEVAQSFAAGTPFAVRVFVNPANLGPTANFEQAMALCTGELIAFADQDDIWKPEKLDRLASALSSNPRAGYAFSNADLVDDSSRPISGDLWGGFKLHKYIACDFEPEHQVAIQVKVATVTGATMLFRARLREFVVPFSRYLLHDYWIAFVSSASGNYGVALPERLISYRRHPQQQIGFQGRSLTRKLRNPVAADELNNKARGYQDAKSRLLSLRDANVPVDASIFPLLDACIGHFKARAEGRECSGLRRLRKVFLEFLTGRYRRFSNSWQSIIRDLLF